LLLAAVSYETLKNVLPLTSGSENGLSITVLLQDAGKQLPHLYTASWRGGLQRKSSLRIVV